MIDAELTTLPSEQTEPAVGNYFVAAYPPFSVWEPRQALTAAENIGTQPSSDPLGLYVHIPFCHKKCDYCYYLSYVGQGRDVVERYLETLVKELSLYAARPGIAGREVAYVYFGGGTPSTLTEAQVGHLCDGLRGALSWNGVREITFECAPRTVRKDFLEALKAAGVTRVSMGVQSFDDDLLKVNGRVHLRADIERAYAMLRAAEFEWVNLDLMVGLMGETWELWNDSIARMIELSPESVTIYQTEVPYNTQLYRGLQAGYVWAQLIPWNEKHARLRHGFQKLEEAGYEVVSAYSAVKDPDRQRFVYQDHLWHGGDMLGLGVASFSYLGGIHFQNDVVLEKYERHVDAGMLPLKRAFHLSQRDRLVREVVLQLKLGKLDTEYFARKLGVHLAEEFATPLRELSDKGWLTVEASEITLTAEGLANADWLVRRFFDPQFQDLRYT